MVFVTGEVMSEESVECSIQYIVQNYIEVALFFSLRVWLSLLLFQVAKQLKEQQMVMRGHRDKSMVHELNRYTFSYILWQLL